MAEETRQKLNTSTKLRDAEAEIVQLQEQLEEDEENQRQLQLKITQLQQHVREGFLYFAIMALALLCSRNALADILCNR